MISTRHKTTERPLVTTAQHNGILVEEDDWRYHYETMKTSSCSRDDGNISHGPPRLMVARYQLPINLQSQDHALRSRAA
ncbi:hypothetical protein J6590_030428 [Homalodisca vitripennis]|nr:hypothetical protein J6590_030428 [Homalodisca vitripennis]